MEEIGVNFMERKQTRGELCLTEATCKFHPSLLDLLDQLGVVYDKLSEIPVGKVYKEVNSHDNSSMVNLWEEEFPFSQTYSTDIGKEYTMLPGTMGYFFYDNKSMFCDLVCRVLECEVDGFFYFPMWIFPANGVTSRYHWFEKSNPGIKMPKRLPTPHNFKSHLQTKVVAALPHTMCAYKFKVTGVSGLL